MDFGLGDMRSSLVLTEKLCPRCGRKCLFPDDGEPGLSPNKATNKRAWYNENLFRGERICKVCCRANYIEDLGVPPRPPEIKVTVTVTETNAPICPSEVKRITVFDEKFMSFELEYEVFKHDAMLSFEPLTDADALLGVEGIRSAASVQACRTRSITRGTVARDCFGRMPPRLSP